jgi:hypothetical protein
VDLSKTVETKETRLDVAVLVGGIIFSFAFVALIWWAGPRLDAIELLPDQGASWYYWKLPEPTFWSRATAWGFYLVHQLMFWWLIYYAQKHLKRYSTSLYMVNVVALAMNAFFIALHLLQTHVWYDGLAQDVSVWSSQISVIIMLVWILLMENSRRGMFFGKKLPISNKIIRFAREYHGYYFAWATVYTFWFHPMVSTTGHLFGFVYMFFLFLQGSLFFTRVHVNRWWTFALEFTVLLHGTFVAVQQGNNLWPMFAFGFGGLFIITQMHGLGLSRGVRAAFLLIYAGLALYVYSGRGLANIHQITWIPFIEFLSVFVMALLFGGGLWVAARLRGQQEPTPGT